MFSFILLCVDWPKKEMHVFSHDVAIFRSLLILLIEHNLSWRERNPAQETE